MKLIVEMTDLEEIKAFCDRMGSSETKPNITVFATPAPAPEPAPQPAPPLPEGFQQAPESVPFNTAPTAASAQPAPQPVPQAQQTTVTFEMVQKAAIKMVQAQRQEEMRELLNKYGLQSLPELKAAPEKLAAFYADMGVI